MKNAMNNDNSNQPSGAKGSTADVQAAAGRVDEMFNQLIQILSQITASVDHESANSEEANAKLMGLAGELANSLQGQDSDQAEPTMQVVLDIIDTVADMLDSGQITLSKDNAAA